MSWLTRILPKIATKPADAETKKKSPIPDVMGIGLLHGFVIEENHYPPQAA